MSGAGFDQLPVIDRLMARLGGFIHGIALRQPYARQILERAIAEDPTAAGQDIEAKARAWMLIALA